MAKLVFRAQALLGMDLQIKVDLGAVVKLADGLSVAFAIVELSIDLIVDGGEAGKTISAVLPDDIGLYRVGAGIGEIDDGIDHRVILLIEYFAEEQTALLPVLLIRGGGDGNGYHEKESGGNESGIAESTSGSHASLNSSSFDFLSGLDADRYPRARHTLRG